ncbi:MAG: hypothetical protein IID43_06160 [Planctomycetes bacterium]|nr:hypothetical protein [Planctomycetota bacterium]
MHNGHMLAGPIDGSTAQPGSYRLRSEPAPQIARDRWSASKSIQADLEWDHQRINNHHDKAGDDDVDIIITKNGELKVEYRSPDEALRRCEKEPSRPAWPKRATNLCRSGSSPRIHHATCLRTASPCASPAVGTERCCFILGRCGGSTISATSHGSIGYGGGLRLDNGKMSEGSNAMSHAPIYMSKSTVKSLWQEYRIYDDHVEFDTLFGQMQIPFEDIEQAEVSESEIQGLFKGDLHLRYMPALKLDWANFVEHVVVDKREGLLRHILFTPEDPAAFVSALNDALTRFRER